MPVRRATNPTVVQHVWDAIRSTNQQKHTANAKRIIEYLQRIDKCSESDAQLYIQQTLTDELIVSLNKKTKKGDVVEYYQMPTNVAPVRDGKEWYCLECHQGGDVATCSSCFRVFHYDCVPTGRSNVQEFMNSVTSRECSELYDETLCSICNVAKLSANCLPTFNKSDLNYLLGFVLRRMGSKVPQSKNPEARPEWLTDKELSWRANQLLFNHNDMSVIKKNLQTETYTHLHQFLADALAIKHNVAIFLGLESSEHGAAKLMIRDCLYDLKQIILCADCYRYSNERISKWFCLPCKVPHKLVWAKQTGYPHWPAKVIHESDSQFDVRFFGGKHERAILAKRFVKSIDTPQSELQIKSSPTFNKAVEELKLHLQLLENPDEVQKFIDSSKREPINASSNDSSGQSSTSTENSRVQESESVETVRKQLEALNDKDEIIKCAVDWFQTQIDKHTAQISETKKKLWCRACGQEASSYCCWNTAYCSRNCQVKDWVMGHQQVCIRKKSVARKFNITI